MGPENTKFVIVPLMFAVLINMFSARVAFAEAPIQTKMFGTMEYDSKLEAMIALGQKFLARSIKEDVEHMGAILETPAGTYRVSHGKSKTAQNRFHFTVLRPESLKVVAYWHTHGAPGALRDKFSVTDAQTVIKTGLPFYLITPKGELKVLNIAKTGARRTRAQTISRDIRRA